MEIQNIVVALILFAAFAYAGQMIWRKAKSFAPRKSSCAADCGCSGESKTQNLLTQVKR